MIENHWKQVKKIEKAQIVRKYLQGKWMEKGWKGFQISIAQHVSTASELHWSQTPEFLPASRLRNVKKYRT